MISRIDIEDMTDAQDEAPERIWLQEPVGLEYERSWCAEQQSDNDTLYVRADLARPSQAGDERVAGLLDTQIAAQDIIIKRQDVEIARLREALWRLLREAEMDGMESRAGWDCWMHHARAALAAMDTPKGGGGE